MARDIDEKIVQMTFENSDFEEGAKQSIKTLENLNKATSDLGENTDGMQALVSAIDKVNGKFSVMETIATGALLRIGSQAVDAGEKLVKSMTIDQVTAGWQKYDEKTRATKTIMNATGESIDTVNGYLKKLMWFTDETSYNFVDMTSNIGKFTSAGIKLEDATNSMIGIANWAALAGQGANEASRAMYNLSQALGRGYVQWQDWMSVVNANMDTKEIKEMFIETAKAVGTLSEEGKDAKGNLVTFGNFGETLREGWLTTDVLNETLAKYADFTNQVFELTEETGMSAAEAIEQLGDAYEGVGKKAFLAGQVSKTFADALDATADAASSRWMTIFETLFGNLEQQEKFWTDVTAYMYDAFIGGLDAVVDGLKEWSDLGGSVELLGYLETAMEGLVGIIQIFGNAWDRAFGPITGDQILGITRAFEYFLMAVTPTEEFLDSLSRGLSGVLTLLNVLAQYVMAVAKGFEPLLYVANHVLAAFGAVFGITGDLITNFGALAVQEAVLATITDTVRSGVEFLLGGFRSLASLVGLIGFSFYEAFGALTFSLKNGIGGTSEFFDILKSDLKEVASLFLPSNLNLEPFKEKLTGVFETLKSYTRGWHLMDFGPILDSIKEKFADFSGELYYWTHGWHLMDFSEIGDSIKEHLVAAIQFLSEAFHSATDKGTTLAHLFKQFLGPLGTGVREFLDYVISRLSNLSLGDIADVIAAINFAKILKPLDDIKSAFIDMMGSISGTMEEFQKKIKVDSFMTLAKAIAILAASLFILSRVPIDRIAVASTALIALGAGLTGFMYAITKMTDDWDEDKIKGFNQITKSLLPLVSALLLISFAVKKLADLDPVAMAVAIAGVGALLMEMAGFVKLVDGTTIDKKNIASLNAVAVAIRLLVKPITQLGALDLKTLAKGIAGVGAAILELAAFSAIAGKTNGNVLNASMGMIALAAGMRVLYPVILKYGDTEWGQLKDSLLKFAAALGVMTAAMIGLSVAGTQGLAGAVGLSALAASFALLIPQMALLAQFSWDSIGKAIAAFAGVLGAFAIAGLALAPVGPIFAAVAVSLAAFNASIAIILLALTSLTKALPVALAAFVGFSALSSETVQKGVDNIGLLLEGLIDKFISLKAKLKMASITYLSAIVESLVEMAPDIANGVLIIVEEILAVLNERLPGILEELDELLETLTPYVEKFARKAGEIALGFVEGFLSALWDKVGDVAIEIGEWLDQALFKGAGKARKERMNEWYAEEGRKITTEMYGITDDAGKAFEMSVKRSQPQLFKTGTSFAQPVLDGIDETLDRHSPPGAIVERLEDCIQAVVDTVKAGATKLGLSGENFSASFSDKVNAKLNETMPQTANEAMQTFGDTVEKSNAGGKAASTIAKQIKDDTSIEDAAKKKAEAVAQAFTTEFNKISSQLSAIGSKFGIAEAYLGPEDEEGKIAKKKQLLELQKLQEELQILGDKYNISWDQYQNMLANPNASNEEIQKQYADYLSVYEELAKKANEVANQQKELYGDYEAAEQLVMDELRDLTRAQASLIDSSQVEFSEATQEAYNNFVQATTDEQKQYYYDLWNQMKQADAEKIFGDIVAKPLDKEQIKKEVYEQLGLDPSNPVAAFMSVEDLIGQAVGISQQTYLSAVEETYPDIINAYESKLAESSDEVLEFVESEVSPKFARSGALMAESTAEGVTESTPKVEYSAKTMSTDAAISVKQTNQDWVEVGVGMMDGIIEGIEDRRAEVIEAAIEVALAALAAAKNALGIASPSKAFLAVGMFAIDGLRVGIQNGREEVMDATTNVADDMLTPFDTIGDRISKVLDDSIHPVIDPTLDLTGVKRAAKSIDNLWSSTTLRTLGDISLSELSRRDEILAARKPIAPVVENTNNFTQINNSPKPLTDAEIYRQTKKELDWAFKGAQR